MRLVQEATKRTLSFAIAFLVFSHVSVMGDDPEPQFAADDDGVAVEQAVASDGTSNEHDVPGLLDDSTSIPLPETMDDESPIQSDPSGDSLENRVPVPEPSENQAGDIDAAAVGPYSEINATDVELPPEGMTQGALESEVPESIEPQPLAVNGAGNPIEQDMPEEAPCPSMTEFAVSAGASLADRDGHAHAAQSEASENGLHDSLERAADTPTDCGWLVQKLAGYRDAHVEDDAQLQDDVPSTPAAIELPLVIETPIQPVSEPRMLTASEKPTREPSNATQPEPLTLASSNMPAPETLTPPALMAPPVSLLQTLDQRSVAAIYGVFVGVLATLFLLLITLVLRSLANRVFPRTVAVAPGAPTANAAMAGQEPGAAAGQPVAGVPSHPQFMAYPQQQAYMPPYMMHPSFVYADADPRQEERPRRAKPKSSSERKRRGRSTRKRVRRDSSEMPPAEEAERVSEPDATATPQRSDPANIDDHPATSQDAQAQAGVFTKILEQNLQIRHTDGG